MQCLIILEKNCLYSSLEKYYFQSLLNGVFINKKRQPSDLKRTCLLLLKGCIWEKCFLLYLPTEQPVTFDLRPSTCDLLPLEQASNSFVLLRNTPVNGLRQDGGARQPTGNLTFQVFKCQFPHPWVSIVSQIPTPGDHRPS